jgi:hypothetical protein
MSRKYKFHDPDGTYFVTFAVVGWVFIKAQVPARKPSLQTRMFAKITK